MRTPIWWLRALQSLHEPLNSRRVRLGRHGRLPDEPDVRGVQGDGGEALPPAAPRGERLEREAELIKAGSMTQEEATMGQHSMTPIEQHFAAFEQPELFVQELVRCFRLMR